MTAANLDLAMFIPSMAGGGAQLVMATLATEFHRQGLSVELVLTERTGPYLASLPSTLPIVDLGAARVIRSIVPLARYLRRRRPKALLATTAEANLAAIAARALSRVDVHLVVREANTLSAIRIDGAGLKERGIRFLARQSYHLADEIIAPSEGVARDLEKTGRIDARHIHVVHNPVLPLPEDQGVPHKWLEPGEPPVVLGIGRLSVQKDFATLLRATELLRRSRAIRTIILGEGDRRMELETLADELGIEDDIAMPGFVPNPEAYLRRAALFVLSSAWEGLPNVMLQALEAGCPIVSTDCPSGPSEILQGGRLGPLVPMHDHRALALAIEQTLDQRLPRSELRRRAADFALADIAAHYLRVLLPTSNASPHG